MEFTNLAESKNLPSYEKIMELQNSMIDIQCEQPIPTHFFAEGMYLRELTVPAGMLMVGKIHRHEHFLIVTKGKAIVVSEFSRDMVEPGHISVSKPMSKRVVLAIEDTQFITIHLNEKNSKDLEEIEKYVIIKDEDYLLNNEVKS